MHTEPVTVPDLTDRPHHLEVVRHMAASTDVLYREWTEGLSRWFAAPGTALLRPEVNAVFFFETVFQVEGDTTARRHPHYGRFLCLEPGHRVQLTWVTGKGGTEGAETVLTVELTPEGKGTHLRLAHEGFPSREARDGHEQAWGMILAHLDERTAGQLQYRPAELADIPALEAIRNSVRENALVTLRLTREDYVRAFTQEGRAWVCLDAGEPVGFACARPGRGDIWALFVREDHEGRGIGSRLMDLAEAWMFEQGLDTIRLTTAPGTRAERLYARRGWEREGTKGGEVAFVLHAGQHEGRARP